MALPGWNVSEPIELAHKLYKVIVCLQSAPESAKAFLFKINNFRGNLDELQKVLATNIACHPAQDLKPLEATVLECQACVERCEEYCKGFAKLTKDGKGRMEGARQAARWMMQQEKVARLRSEIDGQMNSIGLTLAIKTFADGRTRQSSQSATSGLSPLLRSGTHTSLPPYSSLESNQTQTESPQPTKTPADILGLGIEYKRKKPVPDIPNFRVGPEDGDGSSRQISPTTLYPVTEQDDLTERDSKETMNPLGRRRNTANEVAVSPTGLGIFKPLSEGSSEPCRAFASPTIFSRGTFMTENTVSTSKCNPVFALGSAVVEMAMENLSGVHVSYYKAESRISYRVSTIESLRNKQTGRRYILISPPIGSNIQLYFAAPTERIIAHCEHPRAYDSKSKHRVKFIESYLLISQTISSKRKASDASSALSPSPTSVTSAASVASSGSWDSPVLTTNSSVPREESRNHEYDFENKNDYRSFQELLMGPDLKLHLQVPVQSIMAKRYESKPSEESQLQYLRLWQASGRQTLMYFANVSPKKYKQYRMENLRPVESRSKITIKLESHLPGMVRRRSSSKSPLIIAKGSAQGQANFGGYTDEDDMADLDYLSIKFDSAEDRTAFLREARFHGSPEEPVASPDAFHSRSPT